MIRPPARSLPLTDAADSRSATPPAAPPAAPRRRRRWLRRLGGTLLVLALLVTFAPFALSLAPVRRYVAARVSDSVGRRVTIGGITARWWSGVELRNVEVHNPDGFPGDPLLSVDRVRADLAVFPLLAGRVVGTVDVEKPVVTLLRTLAGKRNTDGLGEKDGSRSARRPSAPPETKEPGEAAKRDPDAMDLSLQVVAGRVVSQEIGGPSPSAPDVVDAIEAAVRVGGRQAVDGWLTALARGAGPSGEDAKIEASVALDARGAGPVKARLPRVDLARVRKLAGAALNVDAIAGTASGDVDVVLDAQGNPSGTVRADLSGVSARRGEATVSWRRLLADVKAAPAGDGTRMQLDATVEALRAAGFAAGGDALDEPRLRVSGVVARTKSGDLAFGEAQAPLRIEGRVVSGTISGTLAGSGEDATADFAGDLSVVLSPTLGRMAGLLATPDADLRGTLRVEARASGQGGVIEKTLEATVRDLVLGGGAGGPPLREPLVTLVATGRIDPGAHTMTISTASLTAGSVTAKATQPIVVGGLREGETARLSAAVSADADLGRLSGGLRAFLPALDDVRGGTVHADARTVEGAAAATTLAWTLTATNLELAAGRFSSQPYVERQATASGRYERTGPGTSTLTVDALRTAPVSLVPGKGSIAMRFGPDSTALDGNATATVDLGAASRVFDASLGLARGEALAGAVTVTLAARASGVTWSAEATLTGRDLRVPASWGDSGVPGRLDGRVVAKSGGAPGRVVVEAATLDVTSGALNAKAKGSARGEADGFVLDLSGDLDGDLKGLAGQVRSRLGPSYDDLAGSGRLTGKFLVAGATAGGGRDLRLDADLAFGSVSSGGLSLENGRVTVKRPTPQGAVLVTAQSSVNRGTLRIDGSVELGKDKSPWKAKADLEDVDTSPLVLGKGAGRFLPMILPTILPAGGATPAMSGLMTATLDLASSSITETDLTTMLRGPGSVALSKGTVSNSTLFTALGGGKASKEVSTLVGLVPVVGKAFRDLGRALVFTDLSSRFELANRQIRLLEVKLRSHSISVDFDGVVGFDGRMSLRIPVRLEGDVGKAVKPYVADRTVPMKVSGKVSSPSVEPDLDLKHLAGKGVLDRLKDALK
jgi:hypothetical protein